MAGDNVVSLITPEMYAKSGTEHAEQVAFFIFCHQNAARYPELSLCFAIPNGGARSKVTGGRLKAEGVKAGVPDIFLPVARGNYHGLFLEIKKLTAGRTSAEQSDWIKKLQEQGYAATVCRGWFEASGTIASYLLLPPSSLVVGKFR